MELTRCPLNRGKITSPALYHRIARGPEENTPAEAKKLLSITSVVSGLSVLAREASTPSNCEIEFILMVLWIVAVRGNPIQFHVLGIEERQDRVVEQVGGRDRGLAFIKFGERHPAVGVDERPRVDAPSPFMVPA
jgi:hypothetical protein